MTNQAALRSSSFPPSSSERLTRTVLLVDTSSERLAWLERVVGERYACSTARDVASAALLLERRRPFLVLAGAQICCAEFLAAVATHGLSTSCAFIAEPGEIGGLVEAYAAQHTFRVLASDHSAEAVLSFVRSALYPRGAARHGLPGIVAELTLSGGVQIRCALLDLSNRGLAVRLDATHDILLPQTHLASVALVRDGVRLLERVEATVRYVETLPGPTDAVAYKVGLEIRVAKTTRRDESGDVLTEPVRILALLEEGLRDKSLTVSLADAPTLVSCGRPARVDRRTRELHLDGEVPRELEPGDVTEGRFELGGASYSFLASVRSIERRDGAGGLALAQPRALRVVRRRRSIRVRPSDATPVTVVPSSPFTAEAAARAVINITASGAAFVISDEHDVLPMGTRIPRFVLRFHDGTELSCRASVRSLVSSGADRGSATVCGVEFDGLSMTEQARIADAIVHAGQPELRDGTGTSFDVLWTFLKESRFLYKEKLDSLRVPQVEATMTRLLGQQNDLLKTSLVVDADRIQGHVSGVRAYRRTWIMQHLAAGVAGRGRLLNLAIIDFLEQLPGIEWIKIWYRPTNRWPTRAFGAFARKLADPSLSHLRTYSYMTSTSAEVAAPATDISIRMSEARDHTLVEAYFVSAKEAVLLRADDLTGRFLLLDEIDAAYAALGLIRRREVLIAERHGRFVGFALLEISSDGLNLSELTNTFRVFSIDPDPDVRAALIARARERYFQLGFTRAIGLAPDGDEAAYEGLGFARTKQYACWTWHRSQYQALYRHILRTRL